MAVGADCGPGRIRPRDVLARRTQEGLDRDRYTEFLVDLVSILCGGGRGSPVPRPALYMRPRECANFGPA